jgi:hypothetical protein
MQPETVTTTAPLIQPVPSPTSTEMKLVRLIAVLCSTTIWPNSETPHEIERQYL